METTNNLKPELKSINNRKCLTKCYPRNTEYVHPIILSGYMDTFLNTCAINPKYTKDPKQKKFNNFLLLDECNLNDNNNYEIPKEIDSILLGFYFNPKDFLNEIYDIDSFDKAIQWSLDKKYLPYDTIKRVQNCSWRVYGNIPGELSNAVIEYYYNLGKKWLNEYINILLNKYSFSIIEKPDEKNDKNLYDIIYINFFTYKFFSSALKKYVYEYQDKWEYIVSHFEHIKKYIFEQLVESMESVIENKNNDKITDKNS